MLEQDLDKPFLTSWHSLPEMGQAIVLRSLQGHTDWVYSFARSPDGKTVASGSWDGEVRLWNFSDGKPIRTVIAAPGFKPAANVQAAK